LILALLVARHLPAGRQACHYLGSFPMDIENLREYCLSKKWATESFPFGDDTLVFKVMGRMFALVNLDGEPSVNLKCDPEKAIALREAYTSILPGYHMNKKHWNTVQLNGSLPEKLIREMITDSYRLVMAGLTMKLKNELKQLL